MSISKQVVLNLQKLNIQLYMLEEVRFNVDLFGCVFLGTPAQVNIELYFLLVVV
jgi:hypothetical protein